MERSFGQSGNERLINGKKLFLLCLTEEEEDETLIGIYFPRVTRLRNQTGEKDLDLSSTLIYSHLFTQSSTWTRSAFFPLLTLVTRRAFSDLIKTIMDDGDVSAMLAKSLHLLGTPRREQPRMKTRVSFQIDSQPFPMTSSWSRKTSNSCFWKQISRILKTYL